jgi:hypothetical protein
LLFPRITFQLLNCKKHFERKNQEADQTINNNFERRFCVQKPKIAVLGLNPHAGDGGVIGKEEIEIIEPAIKELLKLALWLLVRILQTAFSSRKNTRLLMQFWQCITTRD